MSSNSAPISVQITQLSQQHSRVETRQAASEIFRGENFPSVSKLWKEGQAVYVAKYGSTVVGVFSIAHDGVSYILTNIATHPSGVGRHVGRAMLQEAKRLCSGRVRASVMDERRNFYHNGDWTTDSEDNRSGSWMKPRRR